MLAPKLVLHSAARHAVARPAVRVLLAACLVATFGPVRARGEAAFPAGYDPFESTAAADAQAAAEQTSTVAFQSESGPSATLPAPTYADDPDPDDETAADWQPTPLTDLSTNIRLPGGMLPRDYAAERPPAELPVGEMDSPYGATRGWPLSMYHWKASCLCHQPLYFEEINLERYGYGCCGCLQYGVSAAHFFGTVPALPYLMAADCPGECDYTLGHYRPGSCPPWQYHWPPCCDPLATFSEAGILTGLIFLIP